VDWLFVILIMALPAIGAVVLFLAMDRWGGRSTTRWGAPQTISCRSGGPASRTSIATRFARGLPNERGRGDRRRRGEARCAREEGRELKPWAGCAIESRRYFKATRILPRSLSRSHPSSATRRTRATRRHSGVYRRPPHPGAGRVGPARAFSGWGRL